jgi:phosphatidylglycerol:prolipoprotein diacylglycerol transferase
MRPVLFVIGGKAIHTYGVALLVSFITLLILSAISAKEEGFEPSIVVDAFLWAFIGALIGGRLWFVFENFNTFFSKPVEILKWWRGGFSSLGGIFGMLAVFFIYLRKRNKSFISFLDLISPYLALGFTIQKFFGCFMAGCCYGKPTGLPWGVRFTHPLSLVPVKYLSVPLHPVQIYDGLWSFLIFIYLILSRNYYRRLKGARSALFFMLFSLGRFLTGFFRGDQKVIFVRLTQSQIEFLLLFLISTAIYYILKRKKSLP